MSMKLGGDLPDPAKLAQQLDERDERLAAQARRKEERDRIRKEISEAVRKGGTMGFSFL